MRPSARAGRNRRRAYLYPLLIVLGGLALGASFPTINSAYLGGIFFVVTGAAGFVLETGKDND